MTKVGAVSTVIADEIIAMVGSCGNPTVGQPKPLEQWSSQPRIGMSALWKQKEGLRFLSPLSVLSLNDGGSVLSLNDGGSVLSLNDGGSTCYAHIWSIARIESRLSES